MPDTDTVVPLSGSLPDGVILELHVVAMPQHAPQHAPLPAFATTREATRNAVEGNNAPATGSTPPDISISHGRLSPPVAGTMNYSHGPRMSSPSAHMGSAASSFLEERRRSPAPSAAAAVATTAAELLRARGQRTVCVEPGEEEYEVEGSPTNSRAGESNASILQGSFYDAAGAIGDVARSVDRFSRLSTDLANERTLLAWVRTAMAALRTTFAFLKVVPKNADLIMYANIASGCEAAFMVTVIVAGISGYHRYRRIKEATLMFLPPQEFGRSSVKWFYALYFFASVAISFGIFTRVYV
eukprot:NODE_10114_length_1375_cov_10.672276.p1 GENE.NODE_10114_length_1375_cov_10.672276~~NODE_10114_length_1375_cov_10.672276.p1  ORF type:complete len:299 (-),score=69.02 NODE_10114_length_1375_cov_10.672276:182-1078(-)